jgi:hypothetical protein
MGIVLGPAVSPSIVLNAFFAYIFTIQKKEIVDAKGQLLFFVHEKKIPAGQNHGG